jgi:hypothetical protein
LPAGWQSTKAEWILSATQWVSGEVTERVVRCRLPEAGVIHWSQSIDFGLRGATRGWNLEYALAMRTLTLRTG